MDLLQSDGQLTLDQLSIVVSTARKALEMGKVGEASRLLGTAARNFAELEGCAITIDERAEVAAMRVVLGPAIMELEEVTGKSYGWNQRLRALGSA